MTGTEVWYHGTRAGFQGPGGVVLPRSQTRAAGTSAPLNPGMKQPEDAGQYVFITRDIEVARAYAEHASGRGAPKVLVVDPHGVVDRDPEHGYRTDAWRCPWATVKSVQKGW